MREATGLGFLAPQPGPPTDIEARIARHAAELQEAGFGPAPVWEAAALRPTRRWHRAATDAVDEAAWQALCARLSPAARTQLDSASGYAAADWLTAIPTGDGAPLRLADAAYRFAARLRLDQAVCAAGRCPRVAAGTGAPCPVAADARGAQLLWCPYGGFPALRHDAVARALMLLILEIPGLIVKWRPEVPAWRPGESDEFGNTGVPDLGIWRLPGGLPLYIDVVVSVATSASRAGARAGATARDWESRKYARYRVDDPATGRRALAVEFEPFSLEAHGLWGPRAVAVVRRLAALGAFALGVDRGAEVKRWRAVLATALQRENARMFLGDVGGAD